MRRFLARVPSRHEVSGHRAMRPFAHILKHNAIWSLNRRAVTRGVALGLFCGTLVPFGQSLAAALVAVPLRANLAVAALCTFITNPFTTPFFYLAGYETGSWLLHDRSADFTMPSGDTLVELARSSWAWVLGASGPTLLGLLVIAGALSLLGFVASDLSWRAWTANRWRRRRARRAGLAAA